MVQLQNIMKPFSQCIPKRVKTPTITTHHHKSQKGLQILSEGLYIM
jgi:hypothetical protein